MRWQLICIILSIIVFGVGAILGFSLLGSSSPEIPKLIGVEMLGLALFAAGHIP